MISDKPFDLFNSLDLLGLRDCLVESRSYITDEADPEKWSIKHEQDDLVNFATRGNASLIVGDNESGTLGGVIACLCAPV